MSFSFWLSASESRNLSQAEKKIISWLAAQIHKMTTIFNQNGPRLSFCEFTQLIISFSTGAKSQKLDQGHVLYHLFENTLKVLLCI